jgi:hypothetical protein
MDGATRDPRTMARRGDGVGSQRFFRNCARLYAHDEAEQRPFLHMRSDRSAGVPVVDGRAMRRRPPCRDFGQDARSRELAAQLRARAGQISALLREQLADIAEFDRAEAWRGDGAGSMAVWVTDQCGVSASTARQWVRTAADLAELPALSESLASGEMSLDKVAPLAEVASPDTEAEIRSAAAHWTVKQARDLAEWHKATEEALARSAEREFEHRTLRFNDARRTMWVAFTRDEYALAKSALVGRVSADEVKVRDGSSAGRGAEAGGSYVPYDQRLYDILIELFQGAAVAGGGAGRPTGDAAAAPERSRVLRPRLVLHAPLSLLMGIDSGVAELEGVGPVAAEVARRLACDARVTLSVEGPDGSILDQGRARREPTMAQRIEIALRDKGCRVPGCPYCEFTNIHHMNHWTKGGLTNLDNLITLCSRHHNAVHELGWSMHGDANGEVTFVTPTGQTMVSVPSPTWRLQRSVERQDRSRPSAKGEERRTGSGKVEGRGSGPAGGAAGPGEVGRVLRR